MGKVSMLLQEARATLGMGEPNKIQAWYRERNGSAYAGNFAWCDAAVTYWARLSGCDEVLPGGDRAWTVLHARDFIKNGTWRAGTAGNTATAIPGDIVFFDWTETDHPDKIDHVGVVELVLADGRVQTIEGNTSDGCRRRVRSAGVIVGFGRPGYTAHTDDTEVMVKKLPERKRGDHDEHVESIQGLLIARSHSEVTVNGHFDAVTETAVKAVQRWGNVEADGIVGKKTWSVLLRINS